MAGDAPGREQQHETSGEPGIHPATDPRLAVFRLPPEARVTEGDAGRRTADDEVDAPGAHAQDDIEDSRSEPRSHPEAGVLAESSDRSSGRTPTDAPATSDDVAEVDTVTDHAPPTAPPAPRSAREEGGKTEPNRDQSGGAGAAAGAPEAPGAGGSEGADVDSGVDSGVESRGEVDEEADGPAGVSADEGADGGAGGADRAPEDSGAESSEDGSADVGEDTQEDADGEANGSPAAATDTESGSEAEEEPAAEAAAADGAEDADGAGAGSAAGPDAAAEADDADADADAAPDADAVGDPTADSAAGTDPGADEDADSRSDAGTGSDVGAVARTDAGGSRTADAQDGETPSAGTGAPAVPPADAPGRPSAPPKGPGPTVKPLVSDIPAEWPEGPHSGRQAPSAGGTVAFGAPGRPTRAEPAPPPAPLPPAAPPAPSSGPAAGSGGRSAAGAPAGAGAEDTAGREPEGPQGTRSMPVPLPPDKQPLKLLAELTNTPPPPETALRTVVRRFKIWTPLVLLLAIVFVVVQAVRPLPSPRLALTADPAYTFAGTPLPQTMPWPSEGQSVAEVEGLGSLGVHGKQTPVPIASLTKVMTAYVVLHDHPLTGNQGGPTITVDAQAAEEAGSDDQSTAPVKKGQRFDERRMLQLLLIPSGNNIARLLARWDSGTQEAFVAKMTATAKRLGMSQTTYTGASGIEETTVSTAVDQLKLAREVMKNSVFRSVVALPNVDIPGVGRIYNNNNDLVKVGVVGIKTGSSTPAGGALMWAAHKTVAGKEQLVLGVVLQQHGGTTVDDSLQTALTRSQALIDSVQGGLSSTTVVKKGTVVGEVDDGLGGSTPVVTSKDLTAIGWAGMKQELTLTADSDGVPHHAAAGTQVGTLGLGSGAARTTVPVVLRSDLDAPGFGAKLSHF
ncbi:D-alanyl-D-alanine carboxypeptidase [Actinacidiphila reveromycinica]|uniref:D-alanyl-D-alanine carboxypeptidase n=1 Tax=Actinacidiphila reveromycinica TaxID=659352 RepID=UPI001921AC7C|nr:D-alanyl-D-alanine carboxypeptidase [Streptomyces sp. SN-593]